jgi:dTDP-glucose 4,6-dehydratase/UDP-glucuronate decarboxylase
MKGYHVQDSKRILITGGAGFIGSNLAKVLLADGAHVDCVDNLITGRLEAIHTLRLDKNFRFLKMDINEVIFLATCMSTRYDEIYHFACPTGVPNIRVYGEEMLRTCSRGTENVLEIACAQGAKVIYASSAEVYGDPDVFPQSEEYHGNVDPVGPRSAYEEGKRFGEALTRLYSEKYRVDAKTIRIFNTFGVGMSPEDSRVIPRFLKQIRDGRNVIVYGDGTQVRTHLYIGDLIAALLLVMDQGQRGEVYNIGGERQLSILELVDTIKELTPLPVKVEHRPHFIEDHAGRLPMTAKVKELGWEPRVDIREGLRRMLVSYGIPTHGVESQPPLSPAGIRSNQRTDMGRAVARAGR